MATRPVQPPSPHDAPRHADATAPDAAPTVEAGAPEGPSLGILPGLVGYHLRRAQSALFKHFAEAVGAEEGITPGLFGMLQVIAANPGLAQSRLAEAMDVDRSTIVTVVHQLERRGLVVRAPSERDRRSNALRLTPEGRRALARVERLVERHDAEFTRALSDGERRTLIDLLARLHAGAGRRNEP